MRLPWQKGDVETRASGYTDVVAAQLAADAGKTSAVDARTTAVAAACANLWSRALASAVVSPDDLQPVVSPSFLSALGVDLILRGDHVSVIDVEDGRLQLTRATAVEVTGRRRIVYRCEVPAPSGAYVRKAEAAGVVHVRWQDDLTSPWQGVSPLALAGFTATGLAAVERSLSDELGTTQMYLLPLPQGDANSATAGLKGDLKAGRGRLGVVETTAGGWGKGKEEAPRQDFATSRIGASPPPVLLTARNELAWDVATACGVPAALLRSDAPGVTRRAAWRDFIDGNLRPMGRIIAAELSAKLDADVALDFDALTRADTLLGLARAASQLIASGMPSGDAFKLVGLEEA